MVIDITNFTPYASLIGGLLIGLAASILILVNGQIAGVSGILRNAFSSTSGRAWRLAFVSGLIIAPVLWQRWFGNLKIAISTPYLSLILGGLLVGIGTAYASGCTSGHGVCGLARLSPRSLIATLVFMGFGFLTVYLVRHVLS